MTNDNTTQPTDPSPQKKTIMNVYGAFAAVLVMSLIPHPIMALFAFALGIGVLLAAYNLRNKAEPEDLIENHMTYIIRTIWIGSLFMLITTIVASIYVFTNLDYSSLDVCAQALAGGGADLSDPMTAMAAFQSCQEDYLSDNSTLFMNGVVIAGLPILLYFGVRFFKGLRRASYAYRIANPKSWF